MNKEKLSQLESTAKQVRRNIIEMVGVGRAGHLGGSCSAADIVTVLYFYKMRRREGDLQWPDRDRLIFSKGHAALCQYGALAQLKVIDQSELAKVKSLDSKLQGHPDMRKCPGIEANTGSLGQGLSISLGIALGKRMDSSPARVYCIVGDGELDEGQCWEAAMAAANYKADNLVAIIDRNHVQATDETAKIMDSGNIEAKFRAFGWKTFSIDGHNMEEIVNALDQAETVKGKPVAIIADTIKGKGVRFAEGKAAFHNGTLTQQQFDEAMAGLQ
ncbi:MAG: transketolase [Bacillota bacterium]